MELLVEAIGGFGVFGAVNALTGIWEYKLFLVVNYVLVIALLLWVARKLKNKYRRAPRIALLSTLAAFLCTPAVVGIGAAIFVPFPLLLAAQVRWPEATKFAVANLTLLIAFWTAIFIAMVFWECLRYLRDKTAKPKAL